MTQPLCQVRIPIPEHGRCGHRRAWLDQAEPGLLRTACHRHQLPPPDARDGDVFLIDHLPVASGAAGQGFDPAGGEKEDRHGGPDLHMINDRASLPGGTLTVQPGQGGASTLVARVFDRALDQDRSDRTA